jgi:hypothetical protein
MSKHSPALPVSVSSPDGGPVGSGAEHRLADSHVDHDAIARAAERRSTRV